MKLKDKIITITILFIILLSFFVSVFAEEDDEPPLQVKIDVYERILEKAKEAGVDTTEAESLMKDAMMTLSCGFAGSAGTMVDVAVGKLLEGLKNSGWGEEELILIRTPYADIEATPPPDKPDYTPTPYMEKPENTPVPYSSPLSVTTNNNLPEEYNSLIGGASLSMVENLPVYWIKTERFSDLRWDIIESTEGVYNWEQSDRFYRQAHQGNLNILVNISGIPSWDSEEGSCQILKRLPCNKEKYTEFIKTVVERYDCDGFKDADPPVKINYFQLGSEMDSTKNTYGEVQWEDSVENYALLVRLTKQAMKERNPDAKLILGGSSDLSAWGKAGELHPITQGAFEKDGWFVELLESLRNLEAQETVDDGISIYFDGADFHHYGGSTDHSINLNLTYRSLGEGINLMKRRLYEYGYKDTSLWVTGNSVYTGSPAAYSTGEQKISYVALSEKEQAIYLVKSLIITVSQGARVTFWSSFKDDPPGESLRYGTVDTFYSYSGLMHWDQTPKPSFHTYSLLAKELYRAKFNQKFEGLEKDIFGYAFTKENRPFYVFWNDGSEEKTVKINGEVGKIYTVTSLITNEQGEVKIEEIRSDGGIVAFSLGQEPVVVKQK